MPIEIMDSDESRMRMVLVVFALCAACSPSTPSDEHASRSPEPRYASQTSAPSPDYRVLLEAPALGDGAWRVGEPAVPLPPDAKAIGDIWIERLQARGALLGYGLDGKGADGPVSLIDTGLTEAEFDRWTRASGWQAPRHIRWSFVPEMKLPPVSDAARALIRVWPASTARTGAQNEALFHGRVELRDGCFFVGESGGPADKLAWFHAEMGLDVDAAGYIILRNRITGQTLARLGEAMSWGGPATAQIDSASERALRRACGPAEIYVVGSPEASEHFLTQHPHLRSREAPPAPPTASHKPD